MLFCKCLFKNNLGKKGFHGIINVLLHQLLIIQEFFYTLKLKNVPYL